MIGLVLAAFASFLPLRYWDSWSGPLSTRPVFLGVDLMLNLTIFAYLGPTSPFFLYTLGTPLLAGPAVPHHGRGRARRRRCWSATT